jgi:hypothetical protein
MGWEVARAGTGVGGWVAVGLVVVLLSGVV